MVVAGQPRFEGDPADDAEAGLELGVASPEVLDGLVLDVGLVGIRVGGIALPQDRGHGAVSEEGGTGGVSVVRRNDDDVDRLSGGLATRVEKPGSALSS